MVTDLKQEPVHKEEISQPNNIHNHLLFEPFTWQLDNDPLIFYCVITAVTF